jgi:hypothetical protein
VKRLPRLPRVVHGLLGPIAVVRAIQVVNDDVDCNGLWDPNTRTITIARGLALEKAWHVLYHEQTHADLDESGVILSRKQEEAVCDGIALARLATLRRSLRLR